MREVGERFHPSAFLGHSTFLQMDAIQEDVPKSFSAKSGVLGLDVSAMWVKVTPLCSQPLCPIQGCRLQLAVPEDVAVPVTPLINPLRVSLPFVFLPVRGATQNLLRFPFLKASC